MPNIPYFMVQWDYKGEKGYGHVIEGQDTSGQVEEDGLPANEADRGGPAFPPCICLSCPKRVTDEQVLCAGDNR